MERPLSSSISNATTIGGRFAHDCKDRDPTSSLSLRVVISKRIDDVP